MKRFAATEDKQGNAMIWTLKNIDLNTGEVLRVSHGFRKNSDYRWYRSMDHTEIKGRARRWYNAGAPPSFVLYGHVDKGGSPSTDRTVYLCHGLKGKSISWKQVSLELAAHATSGPAHILLKHVLAEFDRIEKEPTLLEVAIEHLRKGLPTLEQMWKEAWAQWQEAKGGPKESYRGEQSHAAFHRMQAHKDAILDLEILNIELKALN